MEKKTKNRDELERAEYFPAMGTAGTPPERAPREKKLRRIIPERNHVHKTPERRAKDKKEKIHYSTMLIRESYANFANC